MHDTVITVIGLVHQTATPESGARELAVALDILRGTLASAR
jgi:hypothetical protein